MTATSLVSSDEIESVSSVSDVSASLIVTMRLNTVDPITDIKF